jgi:iron complex outermembrane receptor protein
MKLKLSILFIGLSLITQAQNSISGIITNTNNEPLFGVEVYAPKLHKGTTSKENGLFLFKNLPKGSIEIVFSYIGYASVVKTVILEGGETSLDMVLTPSVFEMDEVIVSTPFNKLQSENVMKVEYKSVAQLQKQGATTLIQGIASIAGVSQISTGNNIGKPVIRGLSGNRVLVYTQGIRLENQQFGGEHGLGVNEAGIESVEVIKGPASLLYGSDALGGVLYLNPEKFAEAHTVESNIASKYFSNTLGNNTTFGFKASAEKFKYLSRLTYNSHRDYKIPNGNRVQNSRYEEYDFKSGIGLDGTNFSSEIRYNYTLSNIGLPEEVVAENPTVSFVAPYQRIENHVLSAHNHFYFKNSSLDINVGYIANNRKEFEDEHEGNEDHDDDDEVHTEILAPALHMKLKTFTYDAKYHLPKFGNIESIIGVQGLSQSNTNFGEELLIPNAKVNDVGGFTTASLKWKKHSLQGGIRFDNRHITTERQVIEDHHEGEGEEEHEEEEEERVFEAIDRSFSSFTASLGYKTTLFDVITTRLNLATGYRAPNLSELSSNGVHHGTNRFEIGNANLSNEQNFQVDLALEYKNEHIEFYVNGFYNTINDFIFIEPTGEIIDENNVFVYVQDNANLYGGEIGFHFHPHPLDWLHIESSFETVTGVQVNNASLPLIPANTWNNTIRSEFKNLNWLTNGYASLQLESTFAQNNVSDFETSTDGYNLVHFGLGGNVIIGTTTFDVTFNINNILDTEYIAHLSRLKDDGIQNIGRNVVVGLSFNI